MEQSENKSDNWLSARQKHIKELIQKTSGLANAYAEYGQRWFDIEETEEDDGGIFYPDILSSGVAPVFYTTLTDDEYVIQVDYNIDKREYVTTLTFLDGSEVALRKECSLNQFANDLRECRPADFIHDAYDIAQEHFDKAHASEK